MNFSYSFNSNDLLGKIPQYANNENAVYALHDGVATAGSMNMDPTSALAAILNKRAFSIRFG